MLEARTRSLSLTLQAVVARVGKVEAKSTLPYFNTSNNVDDNILQKEGEAETERLVS